MSGARRAVRRRAAREAQQAGLNPRQRAIAVELALLLPGKVRAADLPVWSRPVVDTLRETIRRSGTLKTCERVLRGHPGTPSTLKIEWLLLGMLAANWCGFTFVRREILVGLSQLPDPTFGELAPTNREGRFYTPGLSVFNHQQRRLEGAFRDGRLDLGWFEHAWMKASIPERIALQILLVAIDTTAFPGWHVAQRFEHEADVRRNLRNRYREIHGEDRSVPEFDTDEMRAFAEEQLGIMFGEDGHMLRSEADPDLRAAHKTPTRKRPEEKYSGFATHIGATANLPTDSNDNDDDDDDERMPTYVTAVTTTAANADTGPIGAMLAERTHDIAMKGLHLVQDMDFSRKLETYTIPRRRAGDQVHMNFSVPATIAADKPIHIEGRNQATLVVNCGMPFHEHTPKNLLTLPAELFMPGREEDLETRLARRHDWCWDVIQHDPKTGNMRLRCPNCAGKIYDAEGRIPPSPRLRGDATPVEFPDHVTACCDGTITVTIEDLPTFQSPAYGTPGHTQIMNQRNAVESPFGTARDKGGLEPGTCKAARLEAHALSALMMFVVMNLQTTMDQEIREVQQLLKRHRATHSQDVDETVPAEPDQADEVEQAEPEPADEVQPVDEPEPADGIEVVEAEPADEAQPDEAAPAGEERISDPQELPQAVTPRPNDSGGSVATGHKRPRPPP